MKKRLALVLGSLVVLACLALLMLTLMPKETAPEWHMINVNVGQQGDANLIIDQGVTVMIDAGSPGPAKKTVVPYLKERGISSVDHMFVSHPHTDHYGGIAVLLDAGVKIKNVYYNLPPKGIADWNYKPNEFLNVIHQARDQGANLHLLSEGTSVVLPSSVIEVLYAYKDGKLNDKKMKVNDYSVLMRWSVNGFSTLFTGDLSSPLGTALASDPSLRDHFKADVLKIPHHGVTSIAPNSFFEMVQPRVMMIPSTLVLWNHPRGGQARAWVQQQGNHFCHNGLNGTVLLRFDKNAIYAKSDKPSPQCPAEVPLLERGN